MVTLGQVNFTSIPDGKPSQDTHTISTEVRTVNVGGTLDVTVTLYINGTSIGDLSSSGNAGEVFTFDFVNRFSTPGSYELEVEAVISSSSDSDTVNNTATILISDSSDDRREIVRNENTDSDYTSAFENRSSAILTDIETDSGVNISFGEIDFSPYNNPNISVNTSSRFSEHEIIGGTTVRQKLGEDPRDITISGVCTEDISNNIDNLYKAKLVTLLSERTPNGVRCQVASSSTDPLEDGGAADLDSGQFLYEYNINLIEVDVSI